MPTLSVRDLRKTYPSGIEALREISLDVSAGMFGLLGPNGAGKSTSMKTLATLIEPDQGTISLGTSTCCGIRLERGSSSGTSWACWPSHTLALRDCVPP